MIALLSASAITLTALQAVINAPRDAFRACLKAGAEKASTEKVSGDGIEAYLKSACGVQMQSLKGAVIGFRIKNGMSRKAAVDDADMTVDDYLSSPVDNYKFMAQQNAPAKAAPASSPTQAPTPASVSTQPPKP
jgi:hypothetical protein